MNSVPKVLELNRLADDRFAPHHPEDDPEGWNVVFSGQLLAQMIMAVDAVVEGALDVKSIQTIFSRAGTYDSPLELRTETTHGGRMFGSTTITAYQGDRLLSRGLALVSADEQDLVRHGPSAPMASRVAPTCFRRAVSSSRSLLNVPVSKRKRARVPLVREPPKGSFGGDAERVSETQGEGCLWIAMEPPAAQTWASSSARRSPSARARGAALPPFQRNPTHRGSGRRW